MFCKTQQQPLIPSLDACWQSVTLIGVDQINQAKQVLPGMTGNHDFSNRSYGSCWTAWGCRLATPRYAVRGASRSPRSEVPRPGRLEIAGGWWVGHFGFEWMVSLGQTYLNHPNFQESQFQIHKLNHCRVFETYHRSLLVLPWQFLGAAFVSGAWFQQTRRDQDHTMGWKPLRLFTGLPTRMEHGF